MPPREQAKRTTSISDSAGIGIPPTKKTRFLDPADDHANFASEVDAALENPSATRKGRVKTDGYESDSSDDGEGVVFSRRPGTDGAANVDDDDMFATGPKEEDKAKAGEKKGGGKDEAFLRLGDIEGQEFGRGSGDDGGDSSGDEDEPEDEDDAERRKKAGMGYELSSFNMREEMEEGKFSADGMYVRNFDPHALHDRWMDGFGEREIKLARKRKRRQERAQEEKIRAEEQELAQLGGKDAVEREVLAMLKKGETVLEALQRLGALNKQAKAKQSGCAAFLCFVSFLFTAARVPMLIQLSPSASRTSSQDSRAATDKPPSDVEQLTHLASTLLSLGDTDIYSRTYEELVRSVRSAGKVDPSWVPPSADVKYEYKWNVPDSTGGQGQVFGPYSEEEMQSWYKASYFGLAGEKVQVRPVGGDWATWSDCL
jgi:CD2 antigen cytoplasmic tail-binding protein 2